VKVLILLGSKSDLDSFKGCGEYLDKFGIEYKQEVSSAHRQAEKTTRLINEAEAEGCRIIIAGAGMAAHLPGVVASQTILPVIGVPLAGSALSGVDALYSVVQMPAGIPVACTAIGSHGAKNAAILAAEILALNDEDIKAKLLDLRKEMAEA